MRLFAILLLALPPPARIEETTYEHLAIVSDVICVGTVESVKPVGEEARRSPGSDELEQPFAVATLKLEQLWKGPQGSTRVRFVGSSTWTCDITGVEQGQRVLLLLRRWSTDERKESVWRSELDALLGAEPFYSVCWAGRGELPVLAGESGQPPRVDLEWLPWTGSSKFIALPDLRERTQRILAANALGTVKHPTTHEPAKLAILRQDRDVDGSVRTSVVAALFVLDEYDECFWSVSASGAGAPFRRGRPEAVRRLLYEIAELEGSEVFLDPPEEALILPRELIVTRDPRFSMTRARVLPSEGAPPGDGPAAAEQRLWNEMRRRILSGIPKASQDAGEVRLELGG